MDGNSKHYVFSEYLNCNGADLFTIVCLPEKDGAYPTVIYRNPYVFGFENRPEEELCAEKLQECRNWLNNGYAVVFQHCRGCGRSSGDCIPYINERVDGLFLQDWIRRQSFYNGELYLAGMSYTSSVHYLTAPFAEDIKGAVFEAQDCENYNVIYRNGFYKTGLHAFWYVGMYKRKSMGDKNCTHENFHMLPLSGFSETVFGERAEDLEQIFKHPDKEDDFWRSPIGGGEAHDAIKHANIPILLVTGFYDIYTGGVFDMWNSLDEQTRAKSALVVHPFDHDGAGAGQPVQFENGVLSKEYGDYPVKWLNSIRGKEVAPFEKGKVTYYKLFSGEWCCDEFTEPGDSRKVTLGEGEVTYRYDPVDPASFPGGLSANFGGNAWQDPPNTRPDVISLFTPGFTEDTFVKGKIRAKLKVRSNCEDTCFYMRLSLCKAEGYYGLRDDINQISNFSKDYVPGEEIDMDFTFDEHAFMIHKGEKLRIDISSSASPYLRHTNNKGLFSEQTSVKTAVNTVVLEESQIWIPYING